MSHGQELPRTRHEEPPGQRRAARRVGYSIAAGGGRFAGGHDHQRAYDSYCLADLEQAIDNIFYHPNIGPYVCRQLIQRLVESNPSPAYLYRVVQKFNDDGTDRARARQHGGRRPARSCSTARRAT